MHFAFVDESGSEALSSHQHFLVVALLGMERLREVEQAVVRARRRYSATLASGELKASASPPEVTEYLLGQIAKAPVEILATVIDKQWIVRPPAKAGQIYEVAVAQVISRAVERQPRLEVCLDKRYTSRALRNALERAIQGQIAGCQGVEVSIVQGDSVTHRGLQAVDHVAWALYQKYEHGNPRFSDIIAERIVAEDLIERALW